MASIKWDAADRVSLRTMFVSPTGIKFLASIKRQVPVINATNIEQVALQSMEKQGAEKIIDYIFSLAQDIAPSLKEGVDWVNLEKELD